MKENCEKSRQRGFTLIEVIVVLILVGIMAAMAGTGLVTAVQGYLMAAENAEVSQKAQMAMTRLTREIHQCSDCDVGNAPPGPLGTAYNYRIFDEAHPDSEVSRKLEIWGNELKLGPQSGDTFVLVDQVQSFSLARNGADGTITITLVMTHKFGGNQTFVTKILPRNI